MQLIRDELKFIPTITYNYSRLKPKTEGINLSEGNGLMMVRGNIITAGIGG